MAIPLESLGARLGGAASTGLRTGLENLAQNRMKEYTVQSQKQQGLAALKALLPSIPESKLAAVLSLPEKMQGTLLQNLPALLNEPKPGRDELGEIGADRDLGERAAKDAQRASDLFTPEATKLQREKVNISKEKLQHAKESEAFKETKEVRQRIINDYRSAKKNIEDLGRLEELQASGKLDTPGFVEALDRSGFNIPALLNPESNEYNKIVQNFTRDAKNIFGSRVTNFEIEQFLKTLPNLSMSPQGQQRVISNLKRLERGKKAYYKAYREVLDENKGLPPLDLEERILDKIEPYMDKISEKFKKDLERPVPEAQNKAVTALQAALGTVAGRLPKAAGQAAIGAGTGFGIGGVPGAVLGGLGGGLAGLGGVGAGDILKLLF